MFIYGVSVDNGYKYKRIIENTITKIRANNIYKIEILNNWWKITNLNTLQIFNILITIANTAIHEKFYLSDTNTLIFQDVISFNNFNNTIFSDFTNNILTITDRNYKKCHYKS